MKKMIPARKKHSQLERNRAFTGMMFILPQAILILMFMVYPMYEAVRYSFTDWNGISSTMNYIGFDNYRQLPQINGAKEIAIATVTYALGVTVLTNVAAFIQALALDQRGKGRLNRNVMRSLFFFPSLLSGTIIGILWHIMYNFNNGVINTVLRSMEMTPVNWLETHGLTNIAIIIASTWAKAGLCTVVFMAGLQSIPNDLYESAAIDGASPRQRLKAITLPMMAPSITINIITTTIGAFKDYELPYFISEGLPGHSTLLITQRIYFYGFESKNYGIGSALSVILMLIIVLISLIQLIYLKKREDVF